MDHIKHSERKKAEQGWSLCFPLLLLFFQINRQSFLTIRITILL